MHARGRDLPSAGQGREPAADPERDPDADPEAVARQILLRSLSAQPRTRAELAIKLAQRNVPTPVAERVLDRFEEVGLVDDDAFARAWVESRHRGKGLSRRALAAELRRRGVADHTAATALDALDPEVELQSARVLVRRKLGSTAGLPPQVRLRRLAGLLARKGYPAGLAMAVVRAELDAHDDLAGDIEPRG